MVNYGVVPTGKFEFEAQKPVLNDGQLVAMVRHVEGGAAPVFIRSNVDEVFLVQNSLYLKGNDSKN